LKYKLKLTGLKTPSGTISILALKDLVDTLVETAERGLRLAVQGESVKRGPVPGWLTRSLDFTITGLKKGSTTLTLEAPALGETAEKRIQQQDVSQFLAARRWKMIIAIPSIVGAVKK
jgi:hypothetical protein